MGRDGWKEAALTEISKVETGKWDANHATRNGPYRFYTCAYEHFACDTKRWNEPCLVLPGNGANVGEVFYYDRPFDAYQRTYVISKIAIDPMFLFYHFQLYWKIGMKKSNTVPRLTTPG